MKTAVQECLKFSKTTTHPAPKCLERRRKFGAATKLWSGDEIFGAATKFWSGGEILWSGEISSSPKFRRRPKFRRPGSIWFARCHGSVQYGGMMISWFNMVQYGSYGSIWLAQYGTICLNIAYMAQYVYIWHIWLNIAQYCLI